MWLTCQLQCHFYVACLHWGRKVCTHHLHSNQRSTLSLLVMHQMVRCKYTLESRYCSDPGRQLTASLTVISVFISCDIICIRYVQWSGISDHDTQHNLCPKHSDWTFKSSSQINPMVLMFQLTNPNVHTALETCNYFLLTSGCFLFVCLFTTNIAIFHLRKIQVFFHQQKLHGLVRPHHFLQ